MGFQLLFTFHFAGLHKSGEVETDLVLLEDFKIADGHPAGDPHCSLWTH